MAGGELRLGTDSTYMGQGYRHSASKSRNIYNIYMGTLLRRQESGSTNSSGIYEENAAKNSGNFGLGIGVATAAFSELNGFVLRDVPGVRRPGAMVTLA